MTTSVNTWQQQAQEFILRLFVERESGITASSSDYCTCAHVGTHARLHN